MVTKTKSNSKISILDDLHVHAMGYLLLIEVSRRLMDYMREVDSVHDLAATNL